MTLERGTVILVDLEPTLGHEQQSTSPCVVVSDSAVNSNQRFPLIAIVPVTSTPASGALYPALNPPLWLCVTGRDGGDRRRVVPVSGA